VSKSSLHLASQFSIRLIKPNDACNRAAQIEDTNFTRPEARSGFGIVELPDLSAGTQAQRRVLQNFPAPTVGSDFDSV
jgi:hypothetical protein